MTKITYIAFGTLRTSETAYTCASRCNRYGIVRFHQTIAAARRMGDVRIEDVRIASREEIAADKAAKKARLMSQLSEGATMCEQCHEAPATVYAMGPNAGDWGGRYCEPCASRLGFRITDRLPAFVGPTLQEALDHQADLAYDAEEAAFEMAAERRNEEALYGPTPQMLDDFERERELEAHDPGLAYLEERREQPGHDTDLRAKAERLIGELRDALDAAGISRSSRLAEGFPGSAQLCWQDATYCFARGQFVNAAARARTGLRHLIGES